MKITQQIASLMRRFFDWVRSVNWIHVCHQIFDFIGHVMYKILFSWLLPKRFRELSKHDIFTIIFKSDTPAGKKFDVWLLVMIVLNIVVLTVDSLFGSSSTITVGAHKSFSYWIIKIMEWGFTFIFTFEYYLRIYCLKRPLRYVFSFWGIIDFLSIFPAYLSLLVPTTQALTVLRLLRVMRIFRIFRLQRFQDAASMLIEALKNSAMRILVFMLFVLVTAIIIGTMMYSIEGKYNVEFDSVLSGIYWAVVTITTVGFGDIAPVTIAGRFLAVLLMLLGYSIIAVPMGIVAGETIEQHRRPKRKHSSTRVVERMEQDFDEEDDAIHH